MALWSLPDEHRTNYNRGVRPFALALLVALLGFSVSGIASLVEPEGCAFAERTSHQDCAPTCVTCGCCAQAVEPSLSVAIEVVELKVVTSPTPTYLLLKAEPRDVLHVPKSLAL